jgi:hypothetical protein
MYNGCPLCLFFLVFLLYIRRRHGLRLVMLFVRRDIGTKETVPYLEKARVSLPALDQIFVR